MATEIQNAIAGDLLARAFSLVRRQSLQLEDFIMPVVQLGSLDCGFPPALCRQGSVSMFQSAVAAQLASWRMTVPVGVVARVKRLWWQPAVTTGILAVNFAGNVLAAPATTVTTEIFTDSRVRLGGGGIGPPTAPAVQFFQGSQAAGIASQWFVNATSAGILFEPSDWIVGPGASLDFQAQAALNEAATLQVQWDEFYVA